MQGESVLNKRKTVKEMMEELKQEGGTPAEESKKTWSWKGGLRSTLTETFRQNIPKAKCLTCKLVNF